MIIKELQLTHFGKFHDFALELSSGINVIYGLNESGKSTIHEFIKCMFFGAKRLRGRAAASDTYNRFCPWEGSKGYEGTLNFEHDGKDYRIYRNFEKGIVHLTNMTDGQALSLEHGVISDFLPWFTEENYNNTVSVGQKFSGVDTGFALSLQSHIANMGRTGSENIHLGKALDYLKAEHKKIGSKVSLKQYQEDTTRMEALLESCVSDEELRQAKSKWEQELAAKRNRLNEIRGQKEQLLGEEGSLNEQVRQLAGKIQQLKFKIDEMNVKNDDDLPVGKMSKERKSKSKSSLRALVFMIIGVILALAGIVGFNYMRAEIIYGILVIAVLGIVVGVIMLIAGGKSSGGKKADPAIEETSLEVLNAQMTQALYEYDALKNQLTQATAKKQQLSGQQTQLEKSLDETKKNLEKVIWQQEKQTEIVNAMAVLTERMEETKEQARKVKEELAAIDCTKQIIEQLSEDIHKDLGQYLNQYVERFMDNITGESRRFAVSGDLKVSVDNEKSFVDMNRLSVGTIDQLYLAVRMCAAKVLYSGQSVPLIFDDAFTWYDEVRLQALLTWLKDNVKGQIILLTCHDREKAMFESMSCDYNYLEI